jgi:alkylhydroperoxidase/carboxymuconolactone decarboxylase family protein YurZ
MTDLDPKTAKLKEEFIALRGHWNSGWEAVLRLAPDYFAAYMETSAVPWRDGTLSPKIKELIYLAINISPTHLNEAAARTHIANALRYGAAPAEIMQVCELASVLGNHTMVFSMPVLLSVLRGRGTPVDPEQLPPRMRTLREDYLAARGFWNPNWDGMFVLAPDYTLAYSRMTDAARAAGSLEPKVREFIWIAVDSSTTHLFEDGVRNHIGAALKLGASLEEVVEVLELTCDLGVQSVTLGASILSEEIAHLKEQARDAAA